MSSTQHPVETQEGRQDNPGEEFRSLLENDAKKSVEDGIRTMVTDMVLSNFGHNPHLLAAFNINIMSYVPESLRSIAKEIEFENTP